MHKANFKTTRILWVMAIVSLWTPFSTGCSNRVDVPASLPPLPVKVMTVETGSQTVNRRFSGYTHPWEAAGVGFLIGGRVTSVEVKEGDRVRKGDLLATIDPNDYALIEQLTEAQLDAIKPNYERVVGLIREDALPRAKLDEVEGMYKAAVTQKKQAARQLAYTKLKAPIDGVVMNRGTAAGQVIGPGMPAVIVLNITRLKVKFGVTQKELGLFAAGNEVTVTFDGIAEPVTARVFNVALVPDLTTRLYEVTLEVDNADERLRPGMMGRIEVPVRRAEGFFVPLRAVKRDAGHNHVVYLVDADDKVVERRVVTGDLFGDQIQIVEGLEGGERLIFEGQAFVTPGEKVTVQ